MGGPDNFRALTFTCKKCKKEYGPIQIMNSPFGDGDAIAPVICTKCKEMFAAKAVIKNNNSILIETNCAKCKAKYKLLDPNRTCPNCGEKNMVVSK